jgi:uncharacterized protein YybS (DUF2232 family)
MKKNVRMLTEGSMMLAIIGVFLLLNLQSAGLLEAYLIWAIPLPIIFYLTKFGFKQGLVLALATFFLTLLTGNFITLFYIGGALVVGLVYGYGVRSNRSNGWLILFTTILTAISLFIEMFVLAAVFGYNLLEETQMICGRRISSDAGCHLSRRHDDVGVVGLSGRFTGDGFSTGFGHPFHGHSVA